MKPLSNDQVQELLSEWIKSSPSILPIDLIRLTEVAHGITPSPIKVQYTDAQLNYLKTFKEAFYAGKRIAYRTSGEFVWRLVDDIKQLEHPRYSYRILEPDLILESTNIIHGKTYRTRWVISDLTGDATVDII